MSDETSITKENKPKKIDAVGLRFYGDKFTRYMRVGEITDLLPAFKDYYYAAKVKDPNASIIPILQGFNTEVCEPMGRMFHPNTAQVRIWRRKWDLDLMQQMKGTDIAIIEGRNIHQVVKTRNESRELVLGVDDNELEAGVRTLGGELLNDAMQMLRDDQELEEIYDDETLMKRRNYIVNVFSHTTRLVHGKAALMLKASAEKRETAGFLMNLLARATAGRLSDDEMQMLETTYSPTHNAERSEVYEQPVKI